MKIQCDVCEKAPATLICCADEAALCSKCDTEVHAANKLASKHQRLHLHSLSNKLPSCDICQEKPAFIFCVEERAMYCQDCDETIHSASNLAANHHRYLATGIRVALSSKAPKEKDKSPHAPPPPSSKKSQQIPMNTPAQETSGFTSALWAVDDLLHLSDYDCPDKKEQLGFGENDWFSDIGLFGEQVSKEKTKAFEVPQLSVCQSSNTTSYRQSKYYAPHKKPRIEISDDEDEHFTVPDLG